MPTPMIVYTPDYDIHFAGLERLHPFDGRKYSRAWSTLHKKSHLKKLLEERTISPADSPENYDVDDLLRLVHTAGYLKSLESKKRVALALEFPILTAMPMFLIKQRVINPMRRAVRGTVTGAEKSLDAKLVVNLSGGYHHASRENGEGFCIYSDIAIAIEKLKLAGHVSEKKPAIIIDLDAHQGNGYERIFHDSGYVRIFDMYNKYIYPGDIHAKRRIDVDVPLAAFMNDERYLKTLYGRLPTIFEKARNPSLVIYVAGTDIYEGDMLGNLKVSAEGVFQRDKFVLDSCVERGIPTVMVTAGGYSKASYQIIARSVEYILTELSK